MYWFMLLALVTVVIAVALFVLGNEAGMSESEPDRLYHPLPADRPVHREDLDTLRLPMAVRGYRMSDVDDVLDRIAAELALRDQRIADLESHLAGVGAAAGSQPRRAPAPPTGPPPPADSPPGPGGGPTVHLGTPEADDDPEHRQDG